MVDKPKIEATESREGADEYPVALAAAYAYLDEKALILIEVNRLTQDYRSLRRYQIIGVVRNDKKASVWHDLGPADSFSAPEFSLPSLYPLDELGERWGMEHTVGELLDIADRKSVV